LGAIDPAATRIINAARGSKRVTFDVTSNRQRQFHVSAKLPLGQRRFGAVSVGFR
jgi:hypothetical protein